MRTNVDLDQTLLAEAMRLTKSRTTRAAVETALREMVSRRQRPNVAELVGQGLIATDYDIRRIRRRMSRGPG